jgi:hypothetical protein
VLAWSQQGKTRVTCGSLAAQERKGDPEHAVELVGERADTLRITPGSEFRDDQEVQPVELMHSLTGEGRHDV